MLRTITLIAIIILLVRMNAIAQSYVTPFARVTYNTFVMSELKGLQEEFLGDLNLIGVPGSITDDYPAFIGFQGGLLGEVSNMERYKVLVGGSIEYTSTGGRVHYADYSGESRLDQRAHYVAFGGIVEFERAENESFGVDFQLSLKYIYSRLNNTIVLRIGNDEQVQQPNFHSTSFGIEPAILPSLQILGVRAGLSISYLLNLPTSLEYDSFSNAYLVNKGGEKVSIDWSGARIGLLLSF